ncbi:hypothetical protein E5288_WYG001595 [Bos mutus]|uniref:C2 domain-containing protein n=1 Tax=Bos mutus TaxID=72004 RepID=A0A6B0RH98_9CETA|nr:hypothetical protein [Bos mutus]
MIYYRHRKLPKVDDEDLQDEPLQITVIDHDTYSANDAIGKVYIDIDPLLYSEAATVISGWFPIYDTIHVKRKYKILWTYIGQNAIRKGILIRVSVLYAIILTLHGDVTKDQ